MTSGSCEKWPKSTLGDLPFLRNLQTILGDLRPVFEKLWVIFGRPLDQFMIQLGVFYFPVFISWWRGFSSPLFVSCWRGFGSPYPSFPPNCIVNWSKGLQKMTQSFPKIGRRSPKIGWRFRKKGRSPKIDFGNFSQLPEASRGHGRPLRVAIPRIINQHARWGRGRTTHFKMCVSA